MRLYNTCVRRCTNDNLLYCAFMHSIIVLYVCIIMHTYCMHPRTTQLLSVTSSWTVLFSSLWPPPTLAESATGSWPVVIVEENCVPTSSSVPIALFSCSSLACTGVHTRVVMICSWLCFWTIKLYHHQMIPTILVQRMRPGAIKKGVRRVGDMRA